MIQKLGMNNLEEVIADKDYVRRAADVRHELNRLDHPGQKKRKHDRKRTRFSKVAKAK